MEFNAARMKQQRDFQGETARTHGEELRDAARASRDAARARRRRWWRFWRRSRTPQRSG